MPTKLSPLLDFAPDLRLDLASFFPKAPSEDSFRLVSSSLEISEACLYPLCRIEFTTKLRTAQHFHSHDAIPKNNTLLRPSDSTRPDPFRISKISTDVMTEMEARPFRDLMGANEVS